MPAWAPILLAQQGGAEGTPLIDWWTLIAQVFNFLLLVVLLRVFLYKRIVRAMDQRRKKIASHFEAAEQKAAEAADRAEALQAAKDELDQQREAMLAEARQQADEHRKELLGEAREDVEARAQRWREELQRGREAFEQQVRAGAARGVCQAARAALADLADADLERAMVGVLVRRLDELTDESRRELAAAGKGGVVVATARELPQADRDPVARAIKERLDTDARFETDPDLICGIELRAGGLEVSWTVESYVEAVGRQLAETVDQAVAAGADGAEAHAPDAKDRSGQEAADE